MQPATVLVVEDSPTQRAYLSAVLVDAGFGVREAATGSEALRLAAEGEVEIVLLDVGLPDMDGYEVCRRLKAEPGTAAIPVLLLSNLAGQSREPVHGLEFGADGYLPKAADATELAAHIRALLRARRAEEALRRSEEQFRGAFDHAAVGMALVAPDGRWLQVNRSLCEIVGYSEQEMLARTFQAVTHPDDLAADLGEVRRMLSGEIPHYTREKRYVHKDGHVVWIHLSASLVRDARGRPLHFISQIQDVTRRKQAEAALRESEERTRSVLDTALNAFVSMDAAGVITDWNPQAEATFGWLRREAVGQPLAETIIPLQHRAAYRRGLERFLATGEGLALNKRFEITALHRDGREFPVELTISPVRWRGAHLFNAFVHDISERKRAEQERESLIRQLQEALSAAKRLGGLLPICAWCKNVRTDQGYWKRVEAYIEDRLDVQFTHGLCPACAEKVQPPM